MAHPLVDQLRFTRSEWLRGLEGVSDEDGVRHFGRMNCISWTVGHLAWHENGAWIKRVTGESLRPELDQIYAIGASMSSPALKESLGLWHEVTQASDAYLGTLTTEKLQEKVPSRSGVDRPLGSVLQRIIYHYWYHLGEIQAMRQMIDDRELPQFVGSGIDKEGAYRPG